VVSFIGHVTLPGGQPVQAIGVATIRPRLRLGVDVDTSGTPTTWQSEYNAVASGKRPTGPTKLFWSAGKGLPSWTKYPVPATAIPHLCFVDWPTQAQFTAFLAAYPGTWREAWVTYLQESDRKTTLADYQAKQSTLAGWMTYAPPGVRLVPNITGYWQETHGAPWDAWMPADPRIDIVGVDMYVGGQSGYRPITVQLAPAAAAARRAGKQLVVPEFGVVVPPSPSAANLAERAAWITASVASMRAAGVYAAASWNAPPTEQVGSFRLASGDPGLAALRAELAS
jgi:hypothetical protein